MREGGGGGSIVSGEIELNVTSLHSCLCVSRYILIPFFLLPVASFASFIHLEVVDPARISSYNNKLQKFCVLPLLF